MSNATIAKIHQHFCTTFPSHVAWCLLDSLLVSNPTASRQGIPATTGLWDATPFTCSSLHRNFPFQLQCSTTDLSTADLQRKKSIAPIILLINPMANQPPGSTNCINNATKLIHTGWHPSTVPVCDCGSTITKTRSAHCWITQEYKFHRDRAKACDQAAAEWAKAQDAGPTPILLWPRARHRGADDTWSGWSWVQWHLSRHKVC